MMFRRAFLALLALLPWRPPFIRPPYRFASRDMSGGFRKVSANGRMQFEEGWQPPVFEIFIVGQVQEDISKGDWIRVGMTVSRFDPAVGSLGRGTEIRDLSREQIENFLDHITLGDGFRFYEVPEDRRTFVSRNPDGSVRWS